MGLLVAIGDGANAGNVERFYHPNPTPNECIPATGTPTIQPSPGDIEQDVVSSFQEGRRVIGYSSFNGPAASEKEVVNFAKKIGAQYVIGQGKYLNSVSGPSFGSTAFTRFGAFSFFSPTSIDRYGQVDLFLCDTPRKGIGLATRPLKTSEATALGTNKGLIVLAVRRGSPAFMADILPGDVVSSMGDAPAYDPAALKSAIEAAYGTTVTLKIMRGGREITKQVPLPAGGQW